MDKFSGTARRHLQLAASRLVQHITPKIAHRLLDAVGHSAHEACDAIASEHIKVLGDAEQCRDVTSKEIEKRIVVSHCSSLFLLPTPPCCCRS